jgi:hypothetical protein
MSIIELSLVILSFDLGYFITIPMMFKYNKLAILICQLVIGITTVSIEFFIGKEINIAIYVIRTA